jgi:hypothetical protein
MSVSPPILIDDPTRTPLPNEDEPDVLELSQWVAVKDIESFINLSQSKSDLQQVLTFIQGNTLILETLSNLITEARSRVETLMTENYDEVESDTENDDSDEIDSP